MNKNPQKRDYEEEIRVLNERVMELEDGLKKSLLRQQALQRYLPDELIEQVFKNPLSASTIGEDWELIVLAVHLKNFYSISESFIGNPDNDLLSLLMLWDEMYQHIVNLVSKYNGILSALEIQWLRIFWGIPKTDIDHTENVLKLAISLTKVFEKLPQLKISGENVELEISSGIANGPVFIGQLGSSRRSVPLSIGPGLSHAMLLAKKAKAKQILITGTIADKAKEWFDVEMLASVQILEKSIDIYELPLAEFKKKLAIEQILEIPSSKTNERIRFLLEQGYEAEKNTNWEEALRIYEVIWDLSSNTLDKESNAKLLTTIGKLYNKMSHPEHALNNLQKALDLWREIEEYQGLANTLNLIGEVHLNNGRSAIGQNFILEAIEHSKEKYYEIELIKGLSLLGKTKQQQGLYKEAVDLHKEVLALLQNIQHSELHCQANFDLAITNYYLSNYQAFLDHINESQKIAKKLNLIKYQGFIYYRLGSFYQTLWLLDKAKENQEKALDIALNTNKTILAIHSLRKLAEIFAAQKNIDEAAEYIRRVLETIKELTSRNDRAHAFESAGIISMKMHREKKALTYYQEALKIAIEIENKQLEAKLFLHLAHICEINNEIDKGIAYCEKALKLTQEINYNEIIWRILWCYGRFHQQRGELKLARGKYNSATDAMERVVVTIKDPELQQLYLKHPERKQVWIDLHKANEQISK